MTDKSSRRRLMRRLFVHSLVGPLYVVFLLIALDTEYFSREFSSNESLRLTLSVILVAVAVYSLFFQLWLGKIYWGEKIARASSRKG